MENKLKELYAIYGELMVQQEILNNRIMEIKSKIQQELLTLNKDDNVGDKRK